MAPEYTKDAGEAKWGGVSTSEHAAQNNHMQAAVNGTDERLDAILAELRAIRERIEAGNPQPQPRQEGVIDLKEPKRPRR